MKKVEVMINIIRAATTEIDDPAEAINEILDQISKENLLANSIGIIGCNLDYVLDGTVKDLCDKLPFETIGSTTYISDLCGQADEYQLSLMVITSDTVSFSTNVTEPLAEPPTKQISAAYQEALQNLKAEPKFGLLVAPFSLEVGADSQINTFNNVAGGIPLFGTVALDFLEAVRDPRVIHNGNDYTDCMAFVLVSGDIEPQFFIRSISSELLLKQKAIITSSTGNLVHKVNEMPAVEYLETLGLAKEGEIESIPLIPFSIDMGDGGRPVARAVFAGLPDGSIVCGGSMPEQSGLSIGIMEASDVQKTASDLAEEVAQLDNVNGVLIFSCIGRNRALGLDPLHEIEQIQAVFGDKIPYLFMYSATELFPEHVQGKTLNKVHNDSLIACVF